MKTGKTIEEAIKNSKSYAKRGDKLAKDSIKLVKRASTDILEKLDFTIQDLSEKNVNGSNGVERLVVQLDEIRKELAVLPDKMLDDIKCISKKTINITLFGRTMAGKSTLMEKSKNNKKNMMDYTAWLLVAAELFFVACNKGHILSMVFSNVKYE